jgi:hypothetical protein
MEPVPLRHRLAQGAALGAVVVAAGCGRSGSDLADATAPPMEPRTYTCPAVSSPIAVDGRLDEPPWRRARWTEDFVDIQGESMPTPRFRTRVKMVWDDQHLYIGAELDDPHVWGTLTEHDQIVFHDNDFEVFIDPDGDTRQYYEIEINTLNTIFDLLLERTYLDGGPARHEWNLQGLSSAVWVDGTLNDPSDTDRGWSVEFALPWSSLREYANRPCPPEPGDVWRMNFSRVQWRHEFVRGEYAKIPGLAEDNWVWSPQGVINMHVPQRWGYVEFRD